ncbi:MAG: hypothetical protein NTX82_06165 [Candidatus Parcubacteria bacterium]|nr:hypothetical protein [Candidatus Parcubacteria bacterium]
MGSERFPSIPFDPEKYQVGHYEFHVYKNDFNDTWGWFGDKYKDIKKKKEYLATLKEKLLKLIKKLLKNQGRDISDIERFKLEELLLSLLGIMIKENMLDIKLQEYLKKELKEAPAKESLSAMAMAEVLLNRFEKKKDKK